MLTCAGRERREDTFVDSRYRLSNRLPFHLFHGGLFPSMPISAGFSFGAIYDVYDIYYILYILYVYCICYVSVGYIYMIIIHEHIYI
jgi:hypothetical protein